MKEKFNELKKASSEMNRKELEEEVEDFVNEFIDTYKYSNTVRISLIKHSEPEYDDEFGYTPTGWAGCAYVDEYYIGEELAKLISTGISKGIFHDDEDLGRFVTPELYEFRGEIEGEIFRFLLSQRN